MDNVWFSLILVVAGVAAVAVGGWLISRYESRRIEKLQARHAAEEANHAA